MPEQPSELDVRTWHRWFAAEANNRAWALSERTNLHVQERTELAYAAYAAAHHWSKVGTEEHIARAYLLLGRVHALLGQGDLAMSCATTAFKSITSRESEPWEVALAHAILANAAAASGDHQAHSKHYAQARALGEGLTDAQERDVFLATFNLIPGPDTSSGIG